MTAFSKPLTAALFLLAIFLPHQVCASAFVAWKVAGVPWGEVLNVRKYPSSGSQKRGAYPNGTRLSMTGRCTGGVNLRDIEGRPVPEQKKRVRGQWCEVWHDPSQNSNFETGWVYGKFIAPVE